MEETQKVEKMKPANSLHFGSNDGSPLKLTMKNGSQNRITYELYMFLSCFEHFSLIDILLKEATNQ